jgi:hypothetical protein
MCHPNFLFSRRVLFFRKGELGGHPSLMSKKINHLILHSLKIFEEGKTK